jgi:outer membrane protein
MSKFASCLSILAVLAAGGVASAQTAPPASFFQTGDILARARIAAVIPEDFSSSISVIGGHVQATTTYIPEVDLSYFLNPDISLELIAGTSRHEVSAHQSALGAKADVGSVWVLPPTLTLQLHQQYGSFIPYAGLGLTVMFFYDSHPNTTGGITKAGYSTGIGPTLDAGLDVREHDCAYQRCDQGKHRTLAYRRGGRDRV